MTKRSNQRRGALLLVCLVLLVLFLLLGITFVLVAGGFRRGAQSYRRAHEHRDISPQLMDAVIMDLIRGNADKHSPFHYSNLLDDVYGQPALRGRIAGDEDVAPSDDADDINNVSLAFPLANGQITVYAIAPDSGFDLSQVRGYYNGLVITMLSGGARNQSQRVVDYRYDPSGAIPVGVFSVVAFSGSVGADGQPGEALVDDDSNNGTDDIGELGYLGTDDRPLPDDLVLVNGRPFSGPGHTDLMPNRRFSTAPVPLGGNEEYDAPDWNNPWLAAVLPGAYRGSHIKPSYHDAKLIQSKGSDYTTPPTDATYRGVSFRPIPDDHPDFTGSNPFSDLTLNPNFPFLGPWDVDNDGDGVPDSIWMDVGLPAQTLPDGRVVKPLVALMVRDLDGRLNLNAHGNGLHLQQLAAGYDPSISAPLADGIASADFIGRGSGYGPPEINLGGALLDAAGAVDAATLTQMTNLIDGSTTAGPNGDQTVPGRYVGAGEAAGVGTAQPGLAGLDLTGAIRMIHAFGDVYTLPSSFLTAHDIYGDGAVALDARGNPMYLSMGEAVEFTGGNAYEIQLDNPHSNSADLPFTLDELELVLRPTDIDAGTLPSRILSLAPRLAGYRDLVTTDSWDIPVAPIAVPNETRSTLNTADVVPTHITDIIRARILSANGGDNTTATSIINGLLGGNNNTLDVPDLAMLAPNLIPAPAVGPELLRGMPMNVNRLLADGNDNNSNTIVDEPGDAWTDADGNWQTDAAEFTTEYVYPDFVETGVSGISPTAGIQYTDVPFDHNANGLSGLNADGSNLKDLTDHRARHLYAKQLYFLLMLFSEKDAADTVIQEVGLAPDEKKRIYARRLAQFAVNAVDFRDADDIMTPFEYDVDPFDALGWDPLADGDLTTPTDGITTNVVWGCEAPVALLTETLGLHDRRVKDEPKDLNVDGVTVQGVDTTGQPDSHDTTNADPLKKDADYDQYGLPVGSLFLEIQCVARIHPGGDGDYNAGANGTLGTPALFDASGRLDLERVVDTSPVWRVAISNPHADPNDRVSKKLTDKPQSTTMQPRPFSGLENNTQIQIDRYVWFAPQAPPAADQHTTFYSRSDAGTAKLQPGEFLVVGPRRTTVISELDNTAGNRQMIQLDLDDGTRVNITNPDGTSNYPAAGEVKTPVAIECAAAAPSGWTGGGPLRVGLNVSEPLGDAYYAEPGKLGVSAQTTALEGMRDYLYSDPADQTATLARDMPKDVPGGNAPNANTPVSLIAGASDGYGTLPNYCTAFLQRLANPMLPWNPMPGITGHDNAKPVNPYLTVDWMPVDLSIYNRDAIKTGDPAGTGSVGAMRLQSRERGDRADLDPGRADLYNLWRPAFDDPPTTTGTGNGHAFDHHLVHSFGFLNRSFGDADLTGTNSFAAGGDPLRPFPWITWNDRPFVSEFELMQVPASAPGMLTFEAGMAEGPMSELNKALLETLPFDTYGDYHKYPFSHLLNFFHSSSGGGSGAQLARVFDYLHVPSLFAGTETVFNPLTFSQEPSSYIGSLRPPFNAFPKFREPGRVNVNTIFHRSVWEAILNGHPGPTWEEFVTLRRGYLPATGFDNGAILAYEEGTRNAPSFFSMPFRAAAYGDLVANATGGAVKDVDTTLLRSNTLIDVDPAAPTSAFSSNKDPANETLHDSALRNSYFKYQSINRLGNLLTIRSNVYAVWMTIGYFEVTQRTVDATKYPDGYELGREAGEETGDIRRHRAFYIIDRTIPVGYENGQDYNAEEVIRLRRFIE